MNGPGVLITFEGLDGAGKTTQRDLAMAALKSAGKDVLDTREPGGSPGAEEIRSLLVEGPVDRWSAEAEALLFAAARRDHWETTLKPALDAGKVVLCDRFIDSSRAYQVAGRGAMSKLVEDLHEMTIGREADLTLIYDVDPETTKERGGNLKENRYESFGSAFHTTLRRAFLDIAAKNPKRCRVIDATRPPDAIAVDTFSAIGNAMSRAGIV